MLVSRPTVNIEGLVGGYTGPGGKTILPHQAVAKLDLRLVPDMKASEALAALKAHLAKKGYGDIEVKHDRRLRPDEHGRRDAALIRAQVAVLKRDGIDPVMWPRNAGSWPGIRLHRRAAEPRRPDTSASATEAAPTRPTSTTSSSRRTRRSRASTARCAPSSSTCRSSRRSGEQRFASPRKGGRGAGDGVFRRTAVAFRRRFVLAALLRMCEMMRINPSRMIARVRPSRPSSPRTARGRGIGRRATGIRCRRGCTPHVSEPGATGLANCCDPAKPDSAT